MDFISKAKLQSNFHQLLTWFLSPKSIYVEKEEPWNITLFAKNICFLYKNLPVVDEDLKKLIIDIPEYDIKNYTEKDKNYLKPLTSLKSLANIKFKENLVDFLIHGSISTGDFSKGWSDLDTFVILNNRTFDDYLNLLEFRKNIIIAHDHLLEIDVHQHHGYIYCTEFGLSQYFSHFLPPQVLKNSKSLFGNKKISINYLKNQSAAIQAFSNKNDLLFSAYKEGILIHHKYEDQYLHDNFQNINTMYQLKYFLSLVMTLPAYYLDAIGEPCYKKDSFDIVQSMFKNEWEIIEKASLIRSEWQNKEPHPYPSNKIPGWVVKLLGNNYFYRSFLLSEKMLASIKEKVG